MSAGAYLDAGRVGQALAQAGVNPGDILLLHADAMAAAQFPPMPAQARLDALIEAIQEHLTPAGTLIMPTFTYSFTQGQDYDPAASPSQVGLLSERFRQGPGVRRSLDPIFSVAAWGARAEELTAGQPRECFGEDSFFARLHRARGKMGFLGCGLQVATFLHYVERGLGVTYRRDKRFGGKTRQADGAWQEASVIYYARDLDQDLESDLAPLTRRLEEKGLLARSSMGRVGLICVRATDFFEQARELAAQDPLGLVKASPPKGTQG